MGATIVRGGGGSGGLYDAYVCVRDEKAQNTAGGTFTSGAWQTRTLNTEHADTANIAAVATNQVTLAAGVYRVHATAPAYTCGRHQLRLQDVTNAATLVTGQSNYTGGAATDKQSIAQLAGRFTLTAQTAVELQHRCATTSATSGFGVEANFGTEVYAVVEFWREI